MDTFKNINEMKKDIAAKRNTELIEYINKHNPTLSECATKFGISAQRVYQIITSLRASGHSIARLRKSEPALPKHNSNIDRKFVNSQFAIIHKTMDKIRAHIDGNAGKPRSTVLQTDPTVIINEYLNGMSSVQLGKKYHCYPSSILSILQRNGVPRRPCPIRRKGE